MSILDMLKTLSIAELRSDIQKRKEELAAAIELRNSEINALEIAVQAAEVAQKSIASKPVMIGLMSLEQILSGDLFKPKPESSVEVNPSKIFSPTGFEVTREQRPDLFVVAETTASSPKIVVDKSMPQNTYVMQSSAGTSKSRVTVRQCENQKQTAGMSPIECGYADRAVTYLEAAGPSSAVAIGMGLGMDNPRRIAGIMEKDERFEKTAKGLWQLAK